MAWTIFSLEKQDGVALATVTRDPASSYNSDLLHELAEAVEDVRHDSAVRVMVPAGGGDKFFSAGADLNLLARYTSAGGQEGIKAYAARRDPDFQRR